MVVGACGTCNRRELQPAAQLGCNRDRMLRGLQLPSDRRPSPSQRNDGFDGVLQRPALWLIRNAPILTCRREWRRGHGITGGPPTLPLLAAPQGGGGAGRMHGMHWIADALHVKSLERGCRLHSKAQPARCTCTARTHSPILPLLNCRHNSEGEGDMCWHTACTGTRSPTGSMRRAQSAGSNQ